MGQHSKYSFEMKYIPFTGYENVREVEDMLSLVEYAEEKGIKKGHKEGLKEGRISTLISLVKDGLLTVSEAASRAEVSEDEFKSYMK